MLDEASGLTFSRTVGAAFGAKKMPRRVTSPYDMAVANAPSNGVAWTVADAVDLDERPWRPDADLVPTSATYVLYGQGSFIGLHTDRAGCTANRLAVLSGAPTVFECFPDLVETASSEIYAMSRSAGGLLDHGIRVPLAENGAGVSFVGSVLPHQRRPVNEPVLMLSLCFDTKELVSRGS